MSQVNVDFQGLSIISCKTCRQRKIKCGRQFPKCQNCIKRSCECTYPRTFRKTSTKLTRKRRDVNARFYGFSSVNRSLFEVGMPFSNVDFELEGENAANQMKRFSSSPVFKKYIGDTKLILAAIQSVRSSISCSFFDETVDLNLLEQKIFSKQGADYQTLLLSYAVIIVSERFYETPPDVREVVSELDILLNECSDCSEKVSSLILLSEYYHYNFKIETAWKCIFLAASIGYALGLHTTSSKVWTMLVLQDSLLCSVLGRPTSISCVNSKMVSDQCDGWGEIAILLREGNDMLLNLKSETCVEKAISLDLKIDDVIERTKKNMSSSEKSDSSVNLLVGYLKVCILSASRIKLLFPFFTKHRSIKAQLDENCSSLAGCLCGLFQLLNVSNLTSGDKKFPLRPHFFPAYCSVFQGFLLQFLYTSNELFKNFDEATNGANSIFLPKDLGRTGLFLPSLDVTSVLMEDYDLITRKVKFCSFMTDLFASFRSLLNQRKSAAKKRIPTDISAEDQLATPAVCSGIPSEESDNSSPILMGDIADWITSCFSDGITHFYPSEPPL
ncbi:BAH_G0016200.mRNA.1.CDS.1 [Saccharomyces cerevisiae]|nr:SX2_G0049600.mRNA.1.CDS.1 [Saccharomyces cerevisiae]CAI4431388.1 BAK_1a_G0016320.mRNA.1.CDS.1 [Saccharomyces cerevisiae]CAI4449619.1 BAG_1a_G0016330.mRNA.1.CDS.1 [Saccharomyces cerevisiae]CAI4453239.1 BAH_G0016200.mRNA.1.CDS.1 [Saccharomyces cerevisiae]CAI7106130.1 BAK_1a_G0016320.mRNA.1.CDS.1 [Saccharomyces cerevisiae]